STPGSARRRHLVRWEARASGREISPRCPPRLFSRAGPLEIFEDFARGVAAVDAADPATGVGAGTAQVEIPDGRAVIRVARNRTPGKELVKGEVAVHDVAADQAI